MAKRLDVRWYFLRRLRRLPGVSWWLWKSNHDDDYSSDYSSRARWRDIAGHRNGPGCGLPAAQIEEQFSCLIGEVLRKPRIFNPATPPSWRDATRSVVSRCRRSETGGGESQIFVFT